MFPTWVLVAGCWGGYGRAYAKTVGGGGGIVSVLNYVLSIIDHTQCTCKHGHLYPDYLSSAALQTLSRGSQKGDQGFDRSGYMYDISTARGQGHLRHERCVSTLILNVQSTTHATGEWTYTMPLSSTTQALNGESERCYSVLSCHRLRCMRARSRLSNTRELWDQKASTKDDNLV